MTLDEIRARFPVLERRAYLNAGTNGPVARATTEAMEAQLEIDLAEGRSGGPYIERMLALRARAREQLAALIGVGPDSVALTYSTTDACNVVLGGLDLGPDDEIVTTDYEHFGLLGPLHASGARVRIAQVGERAGDEAFDAIARELGPKTRLLAVSHVSWVTGNLLPIERLAAETGVPLLVDGAQSGGAIEVDASPYDFYTVSCQKWPCGPDTMGALHVRDPKRLRVGRPGYLSQSSYEPDGAFVPRDGAARFDTGWVPPPSLAGLIAALEQPPVWRYEHASRMAARCRELLAERFEIVTAPEQSTLVSWRPEGEASAVTKRCFERDVVVRDLPGTGLVRASCGYWTSEDDLARLLDAVS